MFVNISSPNFGILRQFPNFRQFSSGLERVDHLAPHDLRRTCAKLCHVNGGELEQIQFLLGYVSVLTTQRYLGFKQNLEESSAHALEARGRTVRVGWREEQTHAIANEEEVA